MSICPPLRTRPDFDKTISDFDNQNEEYPCPLTSFFRTTFFGFVLRSFEYGTDHPLEST